MKNTFRLFALAAIVASFAACTKYADYQTAPYVTFDSRSATLNEDAGTIEIPVSAHNITGDCTVTYDISGTAKNGTDYEILDNTSGTISFSPSKLSDVIKVRIIPHLGTYTGNLNLRLTMASVTNDVNMGAITTFPISIIDKDIPVDWKFLAGKWTAQDFLLSGAADGGTYEIAITKVDDTNLTITNLWGGNTVLTGTVEFNSAENTAVIALPARQVVYDATADGYGALQLLGQNAAGNWAYAPVYATVTAEGISIGPWNMVITAGENAGYLWDEGYMTQLKK